MSKFEVSINTLIKVKLSFEEYFVLYCIAKNDKDLLLSYNEHCNLIGIEVYNSLSEDGYINILQDDTGDVKFTKLSLTKEGKYLFEASNTIGPLADSVLFDEFRNNYPSSVREGRKIRRLHGNIKKCRYLYNELLTEVSHEVLCKCARLYHRELKDGGQEMFMQSLETWLRQKNYLQYVDDVEETKSEGGDFFHDI